MARYRFILPVVALLLMLPAGSIAAAEEDPSLAAGRIPPIFILAKSAEEHNGAWASAFHASRTTDLTLAVILPGNTQGEHEVELRIFTPRGHLYQSIRVPLAPPGKSPENRTINGYPMAVPQVALKPEAYRGKTFLKAEIPFPVGGTQISTNSLYGRWRIEAYLDGNRKPSGDPTSLQIDE